MNEQNLNNLSKNKTNLCKKYCQTFKELKNDEITVVKEADEGVTIVIMDSEHYEKMIHKQLEDKNTYKKVNPSCDNETMRANRHLLKQESDYMTNFQNESSNFYGLPKIQNLKSSSKRSKNKILNAFHVSNEKI